MNPRTIAVLAILALPNASPAQVTATAGGSPDHIDLALPVSASVAGRCSLAIAGTYDAPDLRAGFSHDFAFTLQCNVASRVAVQSAHGGLLAPVAIPATGFANVAPYAVTLTLVGNPGVPVATAECQALSLAPSTGSPCSYRGPASLSQGLLLQGPSAQVAASSLRVSAPPYAAAGSLVSSPAYADTLTLTLSVAQ